MDSAAQTIFYLVDYMIWADREVLAACAQLTLAGVYCEL